LHKNTVHKKGKCGKRPQFHKISTKLSTGKKGVVHRVEKGKKVREYKGFSGVESGLSTIPQHSTTITTISF
jgi:hypothetical protein